MVYVENLLSILKKKQINFFSGVPDSVLKNLSLKIDQLSYKRHKIAVQKINSSFREQCFIKSF